MSDNNFFNCEPTVFFNRIRDVRLPERATDSAAGIDFFMPKIDKDFIDEFYRMNRPDPDFPESVSNSSATIVMNGDESFICVPKGARVLIPSGVRAVFYPKASALVQENKTGMACKKGAQVTAQVVDSDYTGELYVGFVNLWEHDRSIFLKAGDKIGQYLHLPVYLSKPEEIDNDLFEKYHFGSERGTGAFGSTDKK